MQQFSLCPDPFASGVRPFAGSRAGQVLAGVGGAHIWTSWLRQNENCWPVYSPRRHTLYGAPVITSGDSMDGGSTREHHKHGGNPPSMADAGTANPAEGIRLPHIQGHVTWVWDIPGNTVHYSGEWRNILRSSSASVLGGSTAAWWPHMHEDDVIPFIDMARDVAEGRTDDYRTLFRVRRDDGTWAWLLSRGSVTGKADGLAVRVEGALMDVSDLRSDVKFLHGSSATVRHDAMLEYSPDLILRMDKDLTPIFASPRIVRCLTRGTDVPPAGSGALPGGMEQEQLIFLREKVHQVFADGVAVREQVTFPTAYGHRVTGEYSFWPEFDSKGAVAAVMTQFRDLTDQVLADKRARLNEMRLDALYRLTQMDSSPQEEVLHFVMDSLISLTRSEDGFLYFPSVYPGGKGRTVWSRRLYDILPPERLPEDSLSPETLRLVTREDGTAVRMMRNGNSLHPVGLPFGGRMRIMRYISAPVTDEGRIVCIAGVCNKETDYQEADLQQLEAFVSGAWLILRRHRFFRELQQAKEAAEHANKVKDQFLANVSHELRTPLNGMITMLQLLELMPLNGQQRRYVATASDSGQALLRIISDILDFSRIESGKMQLRVEPFDLKRTVESALTLFRLEAEKKGLGSSISVDGAIPPALLGDAARIRQILFNLAGNALKFTEHGEIEVRCELLPPRGDGKADVDIAVRDTGIGIAPEMQDTIFEAFTQIDSSSTRKYSGTGLGLSIVRRLVELMDGEVRIESAVGKGATVHCSLRLDLPPADQVPLPECEPFTDDHANSPLDILVAEDDPAGRFAIMTFLQRAGHRPVCVPNGRLALEALMLHPFDCLLSDIQMPDMDGLEVIRRIRESDTSGITPTEEARSLVAAVHPGTGGVVSPIPAGIPAVAVSAHVMSGDEERFLRAGMDFYLAKPLIMKELASVLKAIAGRLQRKYQEPDCVTNF